VALLLQVNTSAAAWPSFVWSDVTVPKPRAATYINWDAGQPNSSFPCGGSSYALVQADGTWGWEDADCNTTYVYLCRMTREGHGHMPRSVHIACMHAYMLGKLWMLATSQASSCVLLARLARLHVRQIVLRVTQVCLKHSLVVIESACPPLPQRPPRWCSPTPAPTTPMH
jgi:hypothetical protein